MDDLEKGAKSEKGWTKLIDDALLTELEEWYANSIELDDVRTRKRKNESIWKIFDEVVPPFKDVIPKVKLASWPTISDFAVIRSYKIPYIDKTGYIYELIGIGHVFLSRPRRFGKTLLVDTVKELYMGSQVLFEGLEIHSKWDWSKTSIL